LQLVSGDLVKVRIPMDYDFEVPAQIAWKYQDHKEIEKRANKRKRKKQEEKKDAEKKQFSFDLNGKTILIIGGSQIFPRYKTIIENSNGTLLNYNNKGPNEYQLGALVAKSDIVLIQSILCSHSQFNMGRDLAKDNDKPFEVLRKLGNGHLEQWLKTIFEREGWEMNE
jgi:hypothetical protein